MWLSVPVFQTKCLLLRDHQYAMCFAVDIFQAATLPTRWLICLFTITGVFSFTYWFILVPVFFSYLKLHPNANYYTYHWQLIYFALAFLIWSILMFVLVGVWYLCRNRAVRNIQKQQVIDYGGVRAASTKVRQTLGLEDDREKLTKNLLLRTASGLLKKEDMGRKTTVSILKIKKEELEDSGAESKEITPLPEYSPEARSSIFDFSEERTEAYERERSPFREFLHLVQLESPSTPVLEVTRKESLTVVKEESLENAEDEPPLISPHSSEESLGDTLDAKGGHESDFSEREESSDVVPVDDLQKDTPEQETEDNSGTLRTTESEYIPDRRLEEIPDPDYENTMPATETETKLMDESLEEKAPGTKSEEDIEETELDSAEVGQPNTSNEDSPRTEPEVLNINNAEPDYDNTMPEAEEKLLHESQRTSAQKNESEEETEETDVEEAEVGPPNTPNEDSPEVLVPEYENPVQESEVTPVRKPSRVLERNESKMFLGNIGKKSSVVSEMYVEVDHGKVIAESAVVLGNFQLLTGPPA